MEALPADPFRRGIGSVPAYVLTRNPHRPVVPHSSRERPRDVKQRRERLDIEPPGQGPDWAIAAGSVIGPENTLKVETRIQIPLGPPV